MQQYYAHPGNAFWYIILAHLGCQSLSYRERVELIQRHDIALWDVMHSCKRQGSLDSNIEEASIVVNEFEDYFLQHANIKAVIFNGAKAEQAYKRRVLPSLTEKHSGHELIRMPSTSPAMASLNKKQKYLAWHEALKRFV